MNILKHVTIEGVWNDRNISIDLHPDTNFLIGTNGSGKTTVINLIAAALNADFQTLDRVPFDNIMIQLEEVGGKRKPSIQVEKVTRSDSPYSEIRFIIKDKVSAKPVIYPLDQIEEQRSIRDYTVRLYREMTQRAIPGITAHLERLVNVKWLSIHRAENFKSFTDDRAFISPVDRKLDELSHEFLKYFSSLFSQTNVETNQFQKKVFLSLIPTQSEQELILEIRRLNFTDEKNALSAIFREFRIDASTRVDDYFNLLSETLDKFTKRSLQIRSNEIFAFLNAWKIHVVVQEWNALVSTKAQIYEPRETFLNIINQMLQRKRLEISEKNELVAVTIPSGKRLSLKQLSSGEKQLIIILGEALLQYKTPSIYIADEPELSLHVAWQEQLIRNLRQINPQAQVLVATHSPDIVSAYGSNVFDMEQIVS